MQCWQQYPSGAPGTCWQALCLSRPSPMYEHACLMVCEGVMWNSGPCYHPASLGLLIQTIRQLLYGLALLSWRTLPRPVSAMH